MPTVLIIDDSPTQAASLSALLLGIKVLQRSSDSLKKWKLHPEQVDLVLIALILSGNNGFECGLRLREFGFPNIVLYSDCPEGTDTDWTRAIGLQGLIKLPAPRQLLRQQVLSFLDMSMEGKEHGKRLAS